ncbi:MAG: hypothetical protein ACK5SF_13945, partial [Hyphomonadaceae bacterium]
LSMEHPIFKKIVKSSIGMPNWRHFEPQNQYQDLAMISLYLSIQLNRLFNHLAGRTEEALKRG